MDVCAADPVAQVKLHESPKIFFVFSSTITRTQRPLYSTCLFCFVFFILTYPRLCRNNWRGGLLPAVSEHTARKRNNKNKKPHNTENTQTAHNNTPAGLSRAGHASKSDKVMHKRATKGLLAAVQVNGWPDHTLKRTA